jgi:hypothetical protein
VTALNALTRCVSVVVWLIFGLFLLSLVFVF